MITIVISSISTAIALFALGWNIYRDIIAKPKLKTGAGIYKIRDQSGKINKTVFRVYGTNWGPGEIVVEKTVSLTRKMFQKNKLAVIIPDFPNNQIDILPKRLKVGDNVQQLFPYERNEDILKITHIGLCDSFGRIHLAKRKHVKQFQKQWREDFK